MFELARVVRVGTGRAVILLKSHNIVYDIVDDSPYWLSEDKPFTVNEGGMKVRVFKLRRSDVPWDPALALERKARSQLRSERARRRRAKEAAVKATVDAFNGHEVGQDEEAAIEKREGDDVKEEAEDEDEEAEDEEEEAEDEEEEEEDVLEEEEEQEPVTKAVAVEDEWIVVEEATQEQDDDNGSDDGQEESDGNETDGSGDWTSSDSDEEFDEDLIRIETLVRRK